MRLGALRRAALHAVTEEEIQALVRTLVRLGRAGYVQAALGVVSGSIDGRPAVDLPRRVEDLERLVLALYDASPS
jgi:hypothetical protein